MRRLIGTVLSGALLLAPTAARADSYLGGCLAGGPNDALSQCVVTGAPAAIMAGVAAPFFVAGAAVTIANELSQRHDELPPGTVTQPGKKPSLTYVPAAPGDPYGRERHAPPAGAAFKFNETATNIATVVTAAAVVGAIIATVASGGGGTGKAKH